jgi:hypothetical protein
LEASAADDDGIAGDCAWSTIISGIRCHVSQQSEEVRADLDAWADLIEGVAELQARRGD